MSKKNVLVVYYSQSGQLLEIANNLVEPLRKDSNIDIDYLEIKPKTPYGFPWNKGDFYNTFPESFLQISTELQEHDEELLKKEFDLVILAYQVWYLTPSIPVNSFLKSDFADKLLKNKPVITVIGCRNMWVQAQEKMKAVLNNVGANLVGHIALVDRNINHISVITIAQWMFSGKKERYLGIFPKPGVSEKDIVEASKFGTPILQSLTDNTYENLQPNLLKLGAIKIKPFLVLVDKRANVLFSKWANLIIKKGDKTSPKRKKWVSFFKFYLLFAIWIIAPIVFIVFLLTYLPFRGRIRKEQKYYSSINQK